MLITVTDLTDFTSAELHELILALRGHDSPLSYSQCQLCKLKDDAHMVLTDRGDA